MLVVTAGGAAATYVGHLGWPIRASYRLLAYPVLRQTPTGPLSEHAERVLVAATETIVAHPVEPRHYVEFFRWRSANLPGHRTLYERFTATVNRLARRAGGCDFAECEPTMRTRILAPAFKIHRAHRLDKLRFGIFERDWSQFDLHIFYPIVALFANTDAWRAVGYDAWLGTPRGLDRYTQPHSLRDA